MKTYRFCADSGFFQWEFSIRAYNPLHARERARDKVIESGRDIDLYKITLMWVEL